MFLFSLLSNHQLLPEITIVIWCEYPICVRQVSVMAVSL